MAKYPTTTAAGLAIAVLLAVVAVRYYRRSRELERQIEVLQGDMHFLRTTLKETEARREAAMRALNQVLDGRAKRPHVSIMRFNGEDYASYKVRAVSFN